jgi:hypothetical protein
MANKAFAAERKKRAPAEKQRYALKTMVAEMEDGD